MAGVEAEKGKLSAAAELAWGVERKADPNQAPLGAFDYWFSPALYRKKWGLNRSGVLMNFVQRDNIRGYKCIKLRVGNLRPLQRRETLREEDQRPKASNAATRRGCGGESAGTTCSERWAWSYRKSSEI